MTDSSGEGIAKLWRVAWRALASMRLALWLLAGLGLLTLVGTLLPQLPTGIDESARAAWFALAQQKYGPLYTPLRSLGLFELYRSPGFWALLAALVINTALCTLNRLRALSRMIRRRRIAALGSLITHLAVITLLLSWAIAQGYAWQESVALATGQTHGLGYSKDLLIRNDGLRIQSDAQGQPVDYTAQLTVLSREREIRTASVRLNAPLRVAGAGVWLVSYEPGVRVQVHDPEGRALTLETESGEQSSGQETLNLSGGPALLRIPSVPLELYISGAAEGKAGTAFYLQAVWPLSSKSEPLLAKTVAAGEEVRVVDTYVDLRVTLYPDFYAIYRLKSDPGALLALLSALTLVLGLFLSLFSERVEGQ